MNSIRGWDMPFEKFVPDYTLSIPPLTIVNAKTICAMYESNSSHYDLQDHPLATCCNETGEVYRAVHNTSRSNVAIKIFNLDVIKDSTPVKDEIYLHQLLHHPCVASVCSNFVYGCELWIVMPIMKHGSARELVERNTNCSEAVLAHILYDVVKALEYLHQKGYVHRSVRGSHILVSESGHSVLSGLRYAASLYNVKPESTRKLYTLPPEGSRNINWLAPEVLAQNLQGYNEKSDIYSVGVTACELANGITPYDGMANTLVLLNILHGYTPILLDRSTIPNETHNDLVSGAHSSKDVILLAQSKSYSQSFHDFVKLCLQFEPVLRPSATQLLNHSFFKHCKKPSGGMIQLFKSNITNGFDLARKVMEDVSAVQDDFSKLTMQEYLDIEWDF